MIREKIKIVNPTGLLLSPAGVLCNEAVQFSSKITFETEGQISNAKSVLSVLGACVRGGDEIELICEGEDEIEAMARMKQIIADGLGE